MILNAFLHEVPIIASEVALALMPVIIIYTIFQIFIIKLPLNQLNRMVVGLTYTFIGLVLFLVGVKVGFQPTGDELGRLIGNTDFRWILIPIGIVFGFVIVLAEPAVRVLNQQIEKVSGGAIRSGIILMVLCIAVAIGAGLGMIRVLTGLSIWWIIVPGYAIAIILIRFSSPVFTAIAFDSGGVASGPMTATFLLPLALGASSAIPGTNPITDAFGIVAMVAMMPLIAIQVLGTIYNQRLKQQELTIIEVNSLNDADLTDEEFDIDTNSQHLAHTEEEIIHDD